MGHWALALARIGVLQKFSQRRNWKLHLVSLRENMNRCLTLVADDTG